MPKFNVLHVEEIANKIESFALEHRDIRVIIRCLTLNLDTTCGTLSFPYKAPTKADIVKELTKERKVRLEGDCLYFRINDSGDNFACIIFNAEVKNMSLSFSKVNPSLKHEPCIKKLFEELKSIEYPALHELDKPCGLSFFAMDPPSKDAPVQSVLPRI